MDSVPTVAERIFTQSKAVMMHETTKTMRMTARPTIKLLRAMQTSSWFVRRLPVPNEQFIATIDRLWQYIGVLLSAFRTLIDWPIVSIKNFGRYFFFFFLLPHVWILFIDQFNCNIVLVFCWFTVVKKNQSESNWWFSKWWDNYFFLL